MSSPLTLRDILLKLSRREDLTRDEAKEAFELLVSGQASEAQIGGMLVGLASKGTTSEELIGAATVLREKVVPIACDSQAGIILDTCGTGGDVKGTFNISTAAAIIAASCGVKVVKHGNRSASSKSGSADVLEKLGVKLEVGQPTLSRCLEEANICFAFARNHHPVMKHVAPARSSLGIPTVFNLLAPMLNPGRARHQLLGVFAPELTDRLATVLRALGSERAWVVNAQDGLDEISTLGPTRVSELRNGEIHTWGFDPASVGIPYARLSDLVVDTVAEAADALARVIAGEPGPKRDIAAVNAAAALVVSQRVKDLSEGYMLAVESLQTGRAQLTLDLLVKCSQS